MQKWEDCWSMQIHPEKCQILMVSSKKAITKDLLHSRPGDTLGIDSNIWEPSIVRGRVRIYKWTPSPSTRQRPQSHRHKEQSVFGELFFVEILNIMAFPRTEQNQTHLCCFVGLIPRTCRLDSIRSSLIGTEHTLSFGCTALTLKCTAVCP